jgi:hypothetical protein
VVAHDEPGNAATGTPADPDYPGMAQAAEKLNQSEDSPKLPTVDQVRKEVLWGNLMGGGAGVEYYFGYRLPENDLGAEDWRSRDQTWTYSAIALDFFMDRSIPFWEMQNADELVGNTQHDNSRYCLAKPGELYLIYLLSADPVTLDLSGATGEFKVHWFNPRTGKDFQVRTLNGGTAVDLGTPPENDRQDWVILVGKD